MHTISEGLNRCAAFPWSLTGLESTAATYFWGPCRETQDMYVSATCFEELHWLCTWALSVPDVCMTKDRATDKYACFFCYKEAHALVTALQAKSCHLAFRICILIAQLAEYEGVHTCLCLARLSYTPLLLRVSSNHRLIKS